MPNTDSGVICSFFKANVKRYEVLPTDIQHNVNSYLSINEQSASIVNRRQRDLFQPYRLLTVFLNYVVKGKQNTANDMLDKHPELQLNTGNVTDFSGRTFTNITAYEYAFWAMDTHMCRMLEAHMDKATKAEILARCETIERDGLSYNQHGVDKNSAHFSFEALKTAYTQYINELNRFESRPVSYTAVKTAWTAVGIAQCDVPVHVINEYCRSDRSFDPRPSFKVTGDTLPRDVTHLGWLGRVDEPFFPVSVGTVDTAASTTTLARGRRAAKGTLGEVQGVQHMNAAWMLLAKTDLAAVSTLNDVRTADATVSLDILGKLNVHDHAIGLSR